MDYKVLSVKTLLKYFYEDHGPLGVQTQKKIMQTVKNHDLDVPYEIFDYCKVGFRKYDLDKAYKMFVDRSIPVPIEKVANGKAVAPLSQGAIGSNIVV